MTPTRYGIDEATWDAAKEEVRAILVERAKAKQTISYAELAATLRKVYLEPQNPALYRLLDDVSTSEDEAGRGLLAALVVHQSGDRMPGAGFFKFAERRGRDTSDEVTYWANELKTVYEAWTIAIR